MTKAINVKCVGAKSERKKWKHLETLCTWLALHECELHSDRRSIQINNREIGLSRCSVKSIWFSERELYQLFLVLRHRCGHSLVNISNVRIAIINPSRQPLRSHTISTLCVSVCYVEENASNVDFVAQRLVWLAPADDACLLLLPILRSSAQLTGFRQCVECWAMTRLGDYRRFGFRILDCEWTSVADDERNYIYSSKSFENMEFVLES